MKSLKKRVATTALAGAMALSLAVPAFAAGTSTKVTASYKAVTIDVTVPTTGTATLNPLGMPVNIVNKDTDGVSASVAGEGHIITPPMVLVNNTELDLKVRASVESVVKGDFTFSSTAWETIPENKNAFVILRAAPGDSTNVLLKADGSVDLEKAAAAEKALQLAGTDTNAAKYKDAASIKTLQEKSDGSFVILQDGTASTITYTDTNSNKVKASLCTLAAKNATTPDPASAGVFTLTGFLGTGGEDGWATTDGFTSTIAFSFSTT